MNLWLQPFLNYCSSLVKNQYHNGHPDLIPAGLFPNDAVQYATQGIEVKASRYMRGWQGHNPEETWLMVFVFDASALAMLLRAFSQNLFVSLKLLVLALQRRIGLSLVVPQTVVAQSPPVWPIQATRRWWLTGFIKPLAYHKVNCWFSIFSVGVFRLFFWVGIFRSVCVFSAASLGIAVRLIS